MTVLSGAFGDTMAAGGCGGAQPDCTIPPRSGRRGLPAPAARTTTCQRVLLESVHLVMFSTLSYPPRSRNKHGEQRTTGKVGSMGGPRSCRSGSCRSAAPLPPSRRRDRHFAGTSSPSLVKRLLKEKNDRLAERLLLAVGETVILLTSPLNPY